MEQASCPPMNRWNMFKDFMIGSAIFTPLWITFFLVAVILYHLNTGRIFFRIRHHPLSQTVVNADDVKTADDIKTAEEGLSPVLPQPTNKDMGLPEMLRTAKELTQDTTKRARTHRSKKPTERSTGLKNKSLVRTPIPTSTLMANTAKKSTGR